MKEKILRQNLAEKEGIDTLNPMQEQMLQRGSEKRDIILLSPTGSGKTVAFLLPVLKMLRPSAGRVQCVVVAPSRELVLQIAGVASRLATEYRVVALYGGHKVEDEVNSLKVVPDIVVSTPGRLLDHAVRRNIDLLPVRILVLDEFDKSLELGFEEEMGKLVRRMKNVSRYILTSATDAVTLPEFLRLDNPVKLDYLGGNRALGERMHVRAVRSAMKDKLEALLHLLREVSAGGEGGPERSIVFVNHRESADRVYDFLKKHDVDAVVYHGALEQYARETALAKFNNGSCPVLVATDLAARGLDIRGVKNVVHYHQPLSAEAYTHRNGRTARVAENGDVWILLGPDEQLCEYAGEAEGYSLSSDPSAEPGASLRSGMVTLRFSAGKREKISRGDILGFLTKKAGLEGSSVGKIDVYDHYCLAAVPSSSASSVMQKSREEKVKGMKLRVSPAD